MKDNISYLLLVTNILHLLYFYSFQDICCRKKQFSVKIFHVIYVIYPPNHREKPYGSVFTNGYQILV